MLEDRLQLHFHALFQLQQPPAVAFKLALDTIRRPI